MLELWKWQQNYLVESLGVRLRVGHKIKKSAQGYQSEGQKTQKPILFLSIVKPIPLGQVSKKDEPRIRDIQ